MAWKQHILVVANLTAGSPELFGVLQERAKRGPTEIYLLVPANGPGGGREKARGALEDALGAFHAAGLEADGTVGANDPFVAVTETWDPKRYDEIIVSTLPMRVSKWLHAGLPERISRTTGALVTHVVSQPPVEEVQGKPPPTHEHLDGVLTPLSVLGWGGSSGHQRSRRPPRVASPKSQPADS